MEQLKKPVEYLKRLINSSNKKKMIENTVIIIIIGAILIIAGGAFRGKDNTKNQYGGTSEKSGSEVLNTVDVFDGKKNLEGDLEKLLREIEGVGDVSVMITYISGKENVPAYEVKRNDNETVEKDSGGGTRNITGHEYENKIAYEDTSGGLKRPIIIKDMEAVVKGVVVVAEGAGEPAVQERISKAVQTLMDIPAYKVQVFKKRR